MQAYLCCAYLALKVEEYNLNVDQFVHVLMTELRAPAAEMILSYEVSECVGGAHLVLLLQLMVMQRLQFHLTVHSPFRPLEGFIIDMRWGCIAVLPLGRIRSFVL